jgi:hypothetical protein
MSSDNDRFGGGFLAGSIFGSITGGLLGAWIATKLSNRLLPASQTDENSNPNSTQLRQPSFMGSNDLDMEDARQSLEEKISQLNSAIDQAREQLSEVNGNVSD